MQIADAVKLAGVVGAGGGGFPTYVKFQSKADTVIANGSECEPILATDKTFLKIKSHLVIEGLLLAMKSTGSSRGAIAIKEHYKDVVDAIKSAIPKGSKIEVTLLENYYPAGDEFMLVYDVTGRAIPEGGLPINVGVVVNNVVTLAQVAEAVNGKPVTRRFLTIAGEVKKPCVVSAPIGSTYKDLVALAGGQTIEDAVLIDGGPMMGKIVGDWEMGIAKTTSGILVLPRDHFVVQTKERSLSREMKRSKSACCQCFRCTDLCPRSNLGHDLFPHMTMRTIDYNQSEPTAHITSAFLCSQCGMCEMVACDIMNLSPRRLYAEYRKQMVQKGFKNPHAKKDFAVRESYKDRKVSIPMVLKKIGMQKYAVKTEFIGDIEVDVVRIPLKKHTGAPVVPVVKLKSSVKQCDVVAASPQDKLGTFYHASISGTVTEVNEDFVEITA